MSTTSTKWLATILKTKTLRWLSHNNHLKCNQSLQRMFNNHLCNYTNNKTIEFPCVAFVWYEELDRSQMVITTLASSNNTILYLPDPRLKLYLQTKLTLERRLVLRQTSLCFSLVPVCIRWFLSLIVLK